MRGVKNPPSLCAHCGGAKRRLDFKYCSIACSAAAHTTRPARFCGVCQVKLRHDQEKYCCTEHRAAGRAIPRGNCQECGKQLVKKQRFHCSIACRAAARPKKPRRPVVVVPRKLPTPEQDAIVRRLYPHGTLFAEVQRQVNALPGEWRVHSPEQLGLWAKRLGVKRTAEALRIISRRKAIKQWAAGKFRPAQPVAPRPIVEKKSPQRIILRELYQIGGQLYIEGHIRASERHDLAAVTRAIRNQEPEHPGFVLTTVANRALSQEWR